MKTVLMNTTNTKYSMYIQLNCYLHRKNTKKVNKMLSHNVSPEWLVLHLPWSRIVACRLLYCQPARAIL